MTSAENPYQKYKHEGKGIISIILSEKKSQCEFVNIELHGSQWQFFSRLQIPLAAFISGMNFYFTRLPDFYYLTKVSTQSRTDNIVLT